MGRTPCPGERGGNPGRISAGKQKASESPDASDKEDKQNIPDYLLNPDMDMPEYTLKSLGDVACIGILEIPALDLELPVISSWSYSSLRLAPCRYSGSAYKGDLVIAAHNYQSHFWGIKNSSGRKRGFFLQMLWETGFLTMWR